MLSINKDDYVNYDIGASLPEGLSYVDGQGLVVYGSQSHGVQRKQLVINPDALSKNQNLFDETKGELNPDLYDQMSLPDGMSFDKNTGLTLKGSGELGKELIINPNSISGATTYLFDSNTQKLNSSLGVFPEGLVYSASNGLEIKGSSSSKSIIINPNGFSAQTQLFETNSPKINESLYDAGGGSELPDWFSFDDKTHTIAIQGFTDEEGFTPNLYINVGDMEQKNIYIIDTNTKSLKGTLPDGMSYTPQTGLSLENTSGGKVVIPVGDGYITDTQELFVATNFIPDPYNSTGDLQESSYYMACNVPIYLTIPGSNTVLHAGLSGYFFNNEDNTTKRLTNIGGSSIHLWEYDKSGQTKKDIIIINDDGLDPNGIQTGINADKITKGTITRPIEITDEEHGQKMVIHSNMIYTQNKIVTSELSGYYTTFQFTNDLDNDTKEFHTKMILYDWSSNKIIPKLGIGIKEEDIKSYDPDMTFLTSEGIQYTGTKSVFKVYPSGNVRVSLKSNDSYYTQIIANAVECVHNNYVNFRSCSYGTEQDSSLRDYFKATWITHCNSGRIMRFWNDGFKAQTTSDFTLTPLTP